MDELLEVFMPILKILRISGLFPYRMMSNGRLRLSLLDMIYSVIVMSTMGLFIYMRFINHDRYKSVPSDLSRITFIIGNITALTFLAMTVIVNICYNEGLGIFLVILWKFDTEVCRVGL